MLKGLVFLWTIIMLFSCHNEPKQLSEEEIASFLILGDSMATEAQTVLMKNVAAAIQKGGTDYAVEFCNTRAIPLTDSIAGHLDVGIQRLSDKNRNPDNVIQTPMDSKAWQKIQSEKMHVLEQDDKGEVFYYKPISIAMPTCLNCHGGNNDITESTREIIAQKYPNDKAIGYKLGDLRGMWKIHLTQ